jgi:phosphotransferase system enzyme I (PtsI)
VLEVVEESKHQLRRDGLAFAEEVPVGIMIEMPSAAIVADHLARRVDFFSIGTNDLIQYTLAVDRVNEHVAYLYEPLHPALLRLIEMAVRAARDAGIPVGLCGEMASDASVAPILLGLGLTELSMNAVAIPQVKQIIRSSRVSDLADLAAQAMAMSSAPEIKEMVWRYLERPRG